MPSKEQLKAAVEDEIDRRADEIIRVAHHILDNPEPGFRESNTSAFIVERFREMGIPYRQGLALTGIKGVLEGGSPGPTVAVIGEMDSLVVPDHPKARPDTGAAHACGHHAQIAQIIGVGMSLLTAQVLQSLAGRVVLFAVPAEEGIEVEYRTGLRKEGKIEFLGGKAELVRLGEFDDVDMAMMTHTTSNPADKLLAVGGSSNGTVSKYIQFIGRGAHAGAAPHRGINALNAAMLALSAIHANRESFRDEDTVRVHPIITRGGDAVSAVPADVRMETFVRARTLEALRDAEMKVDRALRAGALALGAKVRITTMPGYMPLRSNPQLAALFQANAESVVGKGNVASSRHRAGSTDMGDLSQIMPAIHPYAGGATGLTHGSDYLVQDYRLAVLNPAKIMAMNLVDLLADGATGAQRVLEQSNPSLTKEAYLSLMRGLAREEEFQEDEL